MSDIPDVVVARMMVKCGRRCCICRRFRPTKLQVHHIVERGQGGTDDEENLIVTCLTCHSDVHTKVPFARRFSVLELKGQRDAVIGMVAAGILPVMDTDDTEEVMRGIRYAQDSATATHVNLSEEATELLLRAINGRRDEGTIIPATDSEGLHFSVGGESVRWDSSPKRSMAKYKQALKELVRLRLVELLPDEVYEVTYAGYLVADELMASRPQELDATPGCHALAAKPGYRRR